MARPRHSIGRTQAVVACCRILGGLLERRQTEFRQNEDAAAPFGIVLRCLPYCTQESFMSVVFVFVLVLLFVPGAILANASAKDAAPMVLIPAGPFPMGVPPGDRDGGRDEYPRHEVYLDAYEIDRYEVTNGRYLAFVKATGHRVPQNPKNPTRNLWQGEAITESLADRPVVNVDWSDATAYCTWAGK